VEDSVEDETKEESFRALYNAIDSTYDHRSNRRLYSIHIYPSQGVVKWPEAIVDEQIVTMNNEQVRL
jgi:hypothetical protein